MLMEEIASFANQLKGTLGMALKDVNNQYYYWNEDVLFPAASMIKIPILIELLRRHDKGDISLETEVRLKDKDKVGGAGVLKELHSGLSLSLEDLAYLMIIISDNTASNMLIDVLGMESINQTIKKMGLVHTSLKRKLMVSPDLPPVNFTTPRETLILLQSLEEGSFLSPASSEKAIKILLKQQYNEKIPFYLPREVKVAHKTGEITGVRHDAGIVFLPQRTYILALFTKDVEDGRQADQIIARISRCIFDYFVLGEHN